MLDDFLQARRALRRRPGFVALAVVTLALGLGANAALFSILNAVVLQPLPYREPDRLQLIRTASRSAAGLAGVSFPDFEDAQSVPSVFEKTALACYWTFNLTGQGVPERLVGARVGGDFFEAMGVRALVGRALGREDDRAGAPEIVVLGHGLWTSFAVRTSQPAQDALRGVRDALLGVDPDQPVYGLVSLEDLRSRSLGRQRLQTALVDLFAALALAGIGSYGVLSQVVRQRRAEIAVRMALGAGLRDVVGLVFQGALVPALLGLLVGLPCAALLARSIESQLFGVRSYDPLTYGVVASLLVASAGLAALLPARRALRVDPAVALREG